MNNEDVLRAADFLLGEYGPDSPSVAARDLEYVLASGNAEGAEFWCRVMAMLRKAESKASIAN